jgi:uncharacterized membrane protein
MDVRLLMIVLRLIHILSGIFWLGAILVMTGFLLPAVRASGGEGARFMSHVMQQRRLQTYVLVAMVLTILAGLAMFGVLSSGGNGVWARSRMGMVLGIGAVLAIVASAAGSMISGPAARKLAVVAQRMQQPQTGGGAPNPADVAEMRALQTRLERIGRLVATLLLLSAATMAVARYV